jgi:ribose/xylose/arabinose/galactoside ABC-type transport system permease subunit
MGVQAEVQSGDEAKHWHGLGPCLYLALLSNGMTLMGVDPYWQEVARGLILLFAVLISAWQNPIKK